VPAPGAIQRVSIRHEGGGWWIANGIPDDVLGPRLRTAGYREAALEGWDARGRRTVRLQPSGTGVTGVLETPAAGGPGMEASIHRDDRPGFDFSALGRLEPGSFRIDGLEPGWWNLEVQWHPKGGEAASSWWTLQRFEYAGGLLDLGTLRAVPGSTLRVRWASTTPWPEGAKLSLWRAGGPESAPPPLAGEAPIADGAFLFRGLRPGGEYYVTCARFPGWSENVLAPDEPGAERTHEAGLDLRLVKCRISFTIDGAKSTRPLMVRGPGVSKILASEDDYVECTIPPGSHAFACHVVDVEQTGETGVVRVKQRGSSLLVAHVEVPNEPEFVATVDLKSK
jgi:hypothetical protein